MVAETSTTADASIEIVNQLLRLPDEVKDDLSRLLRESIDEQFSSLDEARDRDDAKLRRRLDDYAAGNVATIPGAEALADVRSMLAEYRALRAKYRR